MKKLTRPFIILGICLLLALSCATLTYSARSSNLSNTTGAALFFQSTPTPQPEEDKSEVGSTDGIVIMGGVITLIVILPILARRKAWMRT
jgi:hypothetical protein